jgi:hypothetical protein
VAASRLALAKRKCRIDSGADVGSDEDGRMSDNSSPAAKPSEESDEIDDGALADVLRVVPLGAGVLAGGAVALLALGYLAIYLLVFLPRGVVG